jgi:hypothetical protein
VNRTAQKRHLSEIVIKSASSNLRFCDSLEHNALTAVSNKLAGQTTRVVMQPCWLLNIYFAFAFFETCRSVTALCVDFIACSALSKISLNYREILIPYRAVNTPLSVIQTSQLMLYRETIAVCSEIHTKHINTLCGQNVELLNVKLAVHIVTTVRYI